MVSRKAVPLTPDEVEAVERARHGSLAAIAGPDSVRSEASALRALILLGLERVREADQVEGYAALAASEDDEDRAHRAAMRRRRDPDDSA